MKVNLFNANIDAVSMRHLRQHSRVGKENISLKDPLAEILGEASSDDDPWHEHDAFDDHEMMMGGGLYGSILNHDFTQQMPESAAIFGAGMQFPYGMSAQHDESDED